MIVISILSESVIRWYLDVVLPESSRFLRLPRCSRELA